MSNVCLDASFLLDWLLPTSQTSSVDKVWEDLAQEEAGFLAPPLLIPETVSGLRRWVYSGRLTLVEGDAAFQRFFRIPIQIVSQVDLQVRAWQLSAQFNQPRAYDAQYLAVAEREGCELWTTDKRLYNSVARSLPWVRLAGESTR